MELFRLLGTIAIDNTEANTAIDDTSNKAKNAEGNTKKSFGGIDKAAGTLAKGMLGSGALVGELADPINKRLGTIYNRNIRGNTI